MTSAPSGDDPLVRALDGLVRSGDLEPERARAAYEASRGTEPTPPSEPPTDSGLRLDVVGVAVGVALVATAIGLSTAYSRAGSGIDWSNYLIGVIGTFGLLAVAAGGYLRVSDEDKSANLIGWPGAIGVAGAGAMIAVALNDDTASPYVAGVLTVLLAAGGYVMSRAGAYLIVGIVAGFVVYVKLVDDVFDFTEGDGDNAIMEIALTLVVFAVAVTAGGWFLPKTRELTGIFVGAFTVVGLTMTISVVMWVVLLSMMSGFGPGAGPQLKEFKNDIWVVLILSVLLTIGWAVCAWLTGHVGYRVLVLVMPVVMIPLGTAVLRAEHPSWWGLVFGLIGGGVLVVAGLRGIGKLDDLGKRRQPPPRSPDGPPGSNPTIRLEQPESQ